MCASCIHAEGRGMNLWEAAGIGYLLGRRRRSVADRLLIEAAATAKKQAKRRKLYKSTAAMNAWNARMDAKRAEAQPTIEAASAHITDHKFKAGKPGQVLLGHCAICGLQMSEHARR
jgi:hypothetical protein